MAAPAARQRTASAAISADERGTEGFRSGAVTPLIAASMMTGVDMALPYSPTRRQIDRGPSLWTLAAGAISGWQLEPPPSGELAAACHDPGDLSRPGGVHEPRPSLRIPGRRAA